MVDTLGPLHIVVLFVESEEKHRELLDFWQTVSQHQSWRLWVCPSAHSPIAETVSMRRWDASRPISLGMCRYISEDKDNHDIQFPLLTKFNSPTGNVKRGAACTQHRAA